jgi:hypothetical protein
MGWGGVSTRKFSNCITIWDVDTSRLTNFIVSLHFTTWQLNGKEQCLDMIIIGVSLIFTGIFISVTGDLNFLTNCFSNNTNLESQTNKKQHCEPITRSLVYIETSVAWHIDTTHMIFSQGEFKIIVCFCRDAKRRTKFYF